MSGSDRPTRPKGRGDPKTPAARKRHTTSTKGVFWRGTDKDRRYEIAWRCYATCGEPTCKGQHWARTRGGYQDAVKVLMLRREAVEELRARRERGEDITPPPSRTFSQVTDEYLASRAFRRLAPGTQKKYREAFRLRVIPNFGDCLITSITPTTSRRGSMSCAPQNAGAATATAPTACRSPPSTRR